MKLYIEQAFALAMDGDIKGAFATLFQDVEGPEEFFGKLINYLRKIVGIDGKDY